MVTFRTIYRNVFCKNNFERDLRKDGIRITLYYEGVSEEVCRQLPLITDLHCGTVALCARRGAQNPCTRAVFTPKYIVMVPCTNSNV